MTHRLTYVYSFHKSPEKAWDALEDYYASGEVSPCEFAGVEYKVLNNHYAPTGKTRRWCVMLYGD